MLDLRPILYTPGASLPFQFALDLSDLDFPGRPGVTRPVQVEGSVRNSAGALSLELTASSLLDARCDRCGTAFPLEKTAVFRCLLAQELQDEENDDIVLLQDGQADVEDLARTAFILEMDGKILCSEDCKGRCPRCGANWNLGPCSCHREPDPRWAALATLLE